MVAASCAIGWGAVPGVAMATPQVPPASSACGQFSFGFTTIVIGDSTQLTFSGDGPHVDSTANLPPVQGVGQQAHVSGGVDHNGHVDLTMTSVGGGGNTSHLVGDVDPDGNAHGFMNGAGGNSVAWHTSFPLKCVQQDPAPVATDAIVVNTHQALTNVSFDVRNTSATPGNCTYDAHPTNNPLLPPVHRDFHLDAAPAKGSSTQLDFLAPPLGAVYHVAISCEAQGRQIGHFEHDVTGSI